MFGLPKRVARAATGRRGLAFLVAFCVGGLVAGVGYATTALSGIPDASGVFHACVNDASGAVRLVPQDTECGTNWSKVSWSHTGPQGEPGPAGPEGPQGPQGQQGPQGAGGGGDAFSAKAGNEVTIPILSPATLLTLGSLPAGKYAIFATAMVHNINSQDTTPVLCRLVTPSDTSLTYGARIDPFTWRGIGAPSGASTMTIALSLTTQLHSAGHVSLECYSNHTVPTATALAGPRQITAVKVENLVQN
jgi:hypothetical protein